MFSGPNHAMIRWGHMRQRTQSHWDAMPSDVIHHRLVVAAQIDDRLLRGGQRIEHREVRLREWAPAFAADRIPKQELNLMLASGDRVIEVNVMDMRASVDEVVLVPAS